VHERKLIEDIVAAVELASAGERPVRMRVRLGELSHFTPEHFVEHLEDTSLKGVEVDFGPAIPATDPRSQSVLVESVSVAEG
jgi:hydrogenase nickel incorporation protein HypA/HybF